MPRRKTEPCKGNRRKVCMCDMISRCRVTFEQRPVGSARAPQCVGKVHGRLAAGLAGMVSVGRGGT